MLRALVDGHLNRYIEANGGAGDVLFNGRKTTKKMEFETRFGTHGYRFKLTPTPNNSCSIEDEARYYEGGTSGWWRLGDSNDGTSKMAEEAVGKGFNAKCSQPIYDAISSWQIYHFHDTSSTAGMRHYEAIADDKVLREDAANIGPFLKKLKGDHSHEYKAILNAVRLVAPFFDDFLLESRNHGNKEVVNLSWIQKGSDYPMQPYHFSDGSIRFICLATALLQPNPPSAIIIDEPELGLHPAAIVILAELIHMASQRSQVIIATQSPTLVDQFSIEDIIVVNHENSSSTINRLKEEDFREWLINYSIGELWTKNVISAGPVYE